MLILRERRGNTEILTLNRPEAANSLNPELMDELGVALQEILDDDDARALVLTGAGGRIFCAGMDLSALGAFNDKTASDAGPKPGAEALGSFMGGSYAKPVIAAVNGAAVGGGMELVMSCDLVVAAEHARFGLPEVKRGLFAAGGGTMLSTRIPLALALEIGLTGRLIHAPEAKAVGLLNRVVAADALLDEALALADEVAANGPLAVQLTKALMRAAVTDTPNGGRATPEQMAAVFQSDDAREGAGAFMEKRSPNFTGR